MKLVVFIHFVISTVSSKTKIGATMLRNAESQYRQEEEQLLMFFKSKKLLKEVGEKCPRVFAHCHRNRKSKGKEVVAGTLPSEWLAEERLTKASSGVSRWVLKSLPCFLLKEK